MIIGEKIKRLRLRYGLTQEELADRAELSKGFISQVERDLTSPSIATLTDILECLGTNLKDFFDERDNEKIVFKEEDMFVKDNAESGERIVWLIPNAQKNTLEPILMTLQPGRATPADDPHEGEEFGYVLNGSAVLCIGEKRYKLKKGESFYFKTGMQHHIENKSKLPVKVLWISTPPSF